MKALCSVLYVYDRAPFGWHPVAADSDERSRIYALPIDLDTEEHES